MCLTPFRSASIYSSLSKLSFFCFFTPRWLLIPQHFTRQSAPVISQGLFCLFILYLVFFQTIYKTRTKYPGNNSSKCSFLWVSVSRVLHFLGVRSTKKYRRILANVEFDSLPPNSVVQRVINIKVNFIKTVKPGRWDEKSKIRKKSFFRKKLDQIRSSEYCNNHLHMTDAPSHS